jgi:hypothetical protein
MVLAAFVDSDVHPAVLWRPLALGIVGVAVVQVLVSLFTRNLHRAAAMTAVLLVVVRAGDLPHAALALVLLAAVTAAIALYARMRSTRPTIVAFTRAANPISLILLASVVATGVVNGTAARGLADLQRAPIAHGANEAGPNIYLLLLDGHPRADTLRRVFADNNDTFLAGLEQRGFDVASHSRSNYMYTELTLSSMLHMRHARELLDTEPSTRRLIADNPVFDELRQRGYRIFANAPPWDGVSIRSADTFCGDGGITEFEFHLMRSTAIMRLAQIVAPRLLGDRWRDHVAEAFACLASSLDHGGSQLVFIHLPSPHLPIVFEADGSPAPPELYSDTAHELGASVDAFNEAYIGQLRHINERVISAVDEVIAADPDAILLVMSDHGSESRFNWADARLSDLDERFAILFAGRTFGHPCLFGGAPTPVNVFPTLFDAYLGLAVPRQPDSTFASTAQSKRTTEAIPNPDLGRGSC